MYKAIQTSNSVTPKVQAYTIAAALAVVSYQLLVSHYPLFASPEVEVLFQVLWVALVGRVSAWFVKDNASIPVDENGEPIIPEEYIEKIIQGTSKK